MSKEAGTDVLVHATTYDEAGAAAAAGARALEGMAVRGMSEPVTAWAL
jgi:hypothetical protein